MATESDGGTLERRAADRISSLPYNVIDHILAFMPIRDAARTSILARKWRYIYAENPQLVIDEEFSKMKVQNPSFYQYQHEFPLKYVNLVTGILLQHQGPIRKFSIKFPLDYQVPSSDVDRWMLFLSRKGLEDLTLDNSFSNILYKIPSYVFSCPTLAKLSISNSIFKAPPAFEGFRLLTELTLKKVTFESSVLIRAPKLVFLDIKRCRAVRQFEIYAPQLIELKNVDSDIELKYFINCTQLEFAHLSSYATSRVVEHQKLEERISLTELLSCWPNVKRIYLDGCFLKFSTTGSTVPERLQIGMSCLRFVALRRISYNLDQVCTILRLLRSSINLCELEISVRLIIYGWDCLPNRMVLKELIFLFFLLQADMNINTDDTEVVDYFEESGLIQQSMNGLQIVTMKNFQGSEIELLFVKLLLANSPSIERFWFEENKKLSLEEKIKTYRELMQFSRASPKAQMMFH